MDKNSSQSAYTNKIINHVYVHILVCRPAKKNKCVQMIPTEDYK